MSFLNEIILGLCLWAALCLLVKRYLVQDFKVHHVFACLVVVVIFIIIRLILLTILVVFIILLPSLELCTESVALIGSLWVVFLISRSLLETNKWAVRENVLFFAIIVAYVVYSVIVLILSLI